MEVILVPTSPRTRKEFNMGKSNFLHPDGSEFEQFLYASIGEDRNGSLVTVGCCIKNLDKTGARA